MTTYTPISKAEADVILRDYKLGQLMAEPEPVDKGNNNSIYILHTTTGDYVLKIYEPCIDPFVVTSLQERHDFQRFCFDSGIPVAKLIGPLGTFKEHKFEITHKIQGVHPYPLAPQQAYDIGRMLASFHKKAADFPAFKVTNPPSPLSMLGSEITGSIKRIARKGNIAAEFRYASLISAAVAEKMHAMFTMPKYNLPKGKIHGDVTLLNIMADSDNCMHLLDLERANEGVLISDFSQGIVRMCRNRKDTPHANGQPTKLLNRELVEQFVHGYNSVRPLTREELDILPLSIYAQARFFQLAVEKQGLMGRKSDDTLDARRIKAELKNYDFFEMTGNRSQTQPTYSCP